MNSTNTNNSSKQFPCVSVIDLKYGKVSQSNRESFNSNELQQSTHNSNNNNQAKQQYQQQTQLQSLLKHSQQLSQQVNQVQQQQHQPQSMRNSSTSDNNLNKISQQSTIDSNKNINNKMHYSCKLSNTHNSFVQDPNMPKIQENQAKMSQNQSKHYHHNTEIYEQQQQQQQELQQQLNSNMSGNQQGFEIENNKNQNDVIGEEQQCLEHSNKKAKYQLERNDKVRFCSKCALNYALKGEKIQEILDNDQQLRKQETDQFLSKLIDTQRRNQNIFNLFEKKIYFVKEFFSRQIDKVNHVFLQAEKSLHEEKTNIVTNLNQKMWNSINLIDEIKNKTKLYDTNIEKFKIDIEKNYDNIIRFLETSLFRQTIQNQTQILQQTEQYLQSIKTENFEILKVEEDESQLEKLKQFFSHNLIHIKSEQKYIIESSNILENNTYNPYYCHEQATYYQQNDQDSYQEPLDTLITDMSDEGFGMQPQSTYIKVLMDQQKQKMSHNVQNNINAFNNNINSSNINQDESKSRVYSQINITNSNSKNQNSNQKSQSKSHSPCFQQKYQNVSTLSNFSNNFHSIKTQPVQQSFSPQMGKQITSISMCNNNKVGQNQNNINTTSNNNNNIIQNVQKEMLKSLSPNNKLNNKNTTSNNNNYNGNKLNNTMNLNINIPIDSSTNSQMATQVTQNTKRSSFQERNNLSYINQNEGKTSPIGNLIQQNLMMGNSSSQLNKVKNTKRNSQKTNSQSLFKSHNSQNQQSSDNSILNNKEFLYQKAKQFLQNSTQKAAQSSKLLKKTRDLLQTEPTHFPQNKGKQVQAKNMTYRKKLCSIEEFGGKNHQNKNTESQKTNNINQNAYNKKQASSSTCVGNLLRKNGKEGFGNKENCNLNGNVI